MKRTKNTILSCVLALVTFLTGVVVCFTRLSARAEDTYEYVASSDTTFQDGDVVLLTHEKNGTVYALNNSGGTIVPAAVTPVSGKIPSSLVTASLLWTVIVDGGSVKFQSVSSPTQYLNAPSGQALVASTSMSSSSFRNTTTLCSTGNVYVQFTGSGYLCPVSSSRAITVTTYKRQALTAETYSVTFLSDGVTVEEKTVEKSAGAFTLADLQPTEPQKYGYQFLGWSYQGELLAKDQTVEISEDIELTAEYAIGKAYRASISTKGNIGLHFYMQFDEATLADETAKLVCSGALSFETPLSGGEACVVDGLACLKYDCAVSAKDFDREITLSVATALGTGASYTYSVEQYAETLLQTTEEEYASARSFVQTLLTYCGAAKSYFYGGEMPTVEDVSVETTKAYAAKAEGFDDGVELCGVTLLLESETALRVYFKGAVSAVTVNGQAAEIKTLGAYNYVEIPDISAKNLNETIVVEIDGYRVECSPLSYVHAVLTDGKDEALCSVVKALWAYAMQAEVYFGGEK